MLSKCANPACSTPLLYLREGKIFIMERAPEPRLTEQPAGPARKNHRVEHFWLCGACAAEKTLVYDKKTGVQVLPKKASPKRAVSRHRAMRAAS